MHKKCIFLYVSQGFAVRYFLRSRILERLKQSDVEVVILSPNANERVFREAFECDNVRIEQFEHEACENYLKSSRLQRVLKQLRYFVLDGRSNTRTIDDFNRIFKAQEGWDHGLIGHIIGSSWEIIRYALKHSYWLRRLLIRFECFFFRPAFHRCLFEKYQPDLVVTSSLGWWDYDQYLMREARSLGIATAAVILSWDNTSGMGMAGCDADHVVAWTENMKRELIEFHNVPPDKIFGGGVAHWDDYYDPLTFISRDELFRKLGLDPQKKTIFFATKSPNRFPWSPAIISKLADRILQGRIRYPVQLLVRLHPIHYKKVRGELIYSRLLEVYDEVAKRYPFVVLNRPETESKGINFDLKDSETALVASILKHSDVMLNMFSTMVIEAAIFDLPSIHVCIREGFEAADYMKSRQDITIDYVQSHNQRIVQTGAVETVFSMDELVDAINRYLDNPKLHSEQRRYLKEAEAGPYPGNAGETIARHLTKLASLERGSLKWKAVPTRESSAAR